MQYQWSRASTTPISRFWIPIIPTPKRMTTRLQTRAGRPTAEKHYTTVLSPTPIQQSAQILPLQMRYPKGITPHSESVILLQRYSAHTKSARKMVQRSHPRSDRKWSGVRISAVPRGWTTNSPHPRRGRPKAIRPTPKEVVESQYAPLQSARIIAHLLSPLQRFAKNGRVGTPSTK